jgi:CRISPR-associated endoribonuclease Cas6
LPKWGVGVNRWSILVGIEVGKLTVGLLAEGGVRLRGLGGEALHGLFFRILKQYSSDLASQIHEQEEQRPFSLNPTIGDFELNRGYTVVSPGTTLTFDLAFLNGQLLTASVSAFLSVLQDGWVLTLSRKPVVLQNLDLDAGSFSSFPKIFSNASATRAITLEFITPTSFRKNEMQVVFPQPELVFSSLLRRWNAFSALKIPEEHAVYFPAIKVSSYDLHTQLVHFSRYKIIGFRGKVEYELPGDASEDFVREVNALAAFAFYSGVGAKTSMGMGQVRKIS